jgi:6-phosphogluconolactonase (cycloisomerase 2 family)
MVVLDVTSPDPIAQFRVTPDSWTSSDPSVATISSNGLVMPVAPGISTLTATYKSVTDSVILEVWGTPARFVYVANSASNNLSGFSLSISVVIATFSTVVTYSDFLESTQPVPNSPIAVGSSPSALAADPSGKFLFVANAQSNNISAFSIDQTTGSLTPVPGSPFATGNGPASLAVDAGGKYLYVANSGDGNISGYSMDGSTGTLAPLGGFPVATGSNPKAMATDAGGFVYVVNGGSDSLSIFQVNAGTGALSAVTGSPFSTGHEPSAVAEYNPGNFIYVTNQGSNSISGFTHDAGGNFSALTGSPFPLYTTAPSCPGDQPLGLAVDPQVPFAFLSVKQSLGTCSAVSMEAYQIDKVSGMLRNAVSSPAAGTSGPQPAVAVDSSGRFIYVLDAGKNVLIGNELGLRSGPSISGAGETPVGNMPTALLIVK